MIMLILILMLALSAGAVPAQEVKTRPAGQPWALVEVTDRDGNGVEDFFNPGNLPVSTDSVDVEIIFGSTYRPAADSTLIDALLDSTNSGGHVTQVQREIPVIWAGGVGVDGAIVDTTSGEVLNDSFRSILENSGAIAIGAQRVYKAALQTSVLSVRAKNDPALGVHGVWQWSDSGFVADSTRATGRGVTVAILDSGVDNGYFGLNAGQVGFIDIPTKGGGAGDPSDHNPAFHGTRLAAIATGLLPGIGVMGVAPEARIVDVNVAPDTTGYTSMQLIMKGLEWCIRNRSRLWPNTDPSYNGIDLVVTGYVDVAYATHGHIFQSGGDFGQTCAPTYDPPADAAINVLVNKLVDLGVPVVAAAGNCGCDSLYDGGLGLLANASGVIAVSATLDSNTVPVDDDILAPYSSYGDSSAGDQKPEISAPGTDIFNNTWTGCGGTNDYASGTSFAAPHVAGAVALLMERAPDLSPDSLRTLLMRSANSRGLAGWDTGFGAGILDCRAAIDLVP